MGSNIYWCSWLFCCWKATASLSPDLKFEIRKQEEDYLPCALDRKSFDGFLLDRQPLLLCFAVLSRLTMPPAGKLIMTQEMLWSFDREDYSYVLRLDDCYWEKLPRRLNFKCWPTRTANKICVSSAIKPEILKTTDMENLQLLSSKHCHEKHVLKIQAFLFFILEL